jgi:N-hydroxyarylamine O-acetyltransferase
MKDGRERIAADAMGEPQSFDLDVYLERIDYRGTPEPTLATLQGVHRAHLASIPFENIDVRLGRPIGLDLKTLQAKLVAGRRGGYCFEQNSLFAAALEALGFEVATLEARVRPPGATATLARTHMVLHLTVDGGDWIADVGFGGDGPLVPVPLDGTASEHSDDLYRIEREGESTCVLRRSWRGSWRDLYAFTLTPALPVDFEMANYFTSTHPRSRFVRTLTVQRSRAEQRQILRGRVYTVREGTRETEREISPQELPALLEQEFGLVIPPEDATRALGGD